MMTIIMMANYYLEVGAGGIDGCFRVPQRDLPVHDVLFRQKRRVPTLRLYRIRLFALAGHIHVLLDYMVIPVESKSKSLSECVINDGSMRKP